MIYTFTVENKELYKKITDRFILNILLLSMMILIYNLKNKIF